jgi:hypothetical protein
MTTTIQEISRDLKNRYLTKAQDSVNTAYNNWNSSAKGLFQDLKGAKKGMDAAAKTVEKRNKGIILAKKNKDEEELMQQWPYKNLTRNPVSGKIVPKRKIDEVSKSTLVNYMEKSTKQSKSLQKKHDKGESSVADDRKFFNRVDGQIMAKNKFYGSAKVAPSGKDKAYDMARAILTKKLEEEAGKPAPKPAAAAQNKGKSLTLQSGRIAAVGTPAGHQALSDYHRRAALTATSKKDYDNHVAAAQANGQAFQQLQSYAKTPEQYDKRAIDAIIKKASDLTSMTNAVGMDPMKNNQLARDISEGTGYYTHKIS